MPRSAVLLGAIWVIFSHLEPWLGLVHMISGMISRYSSYTWIHIWILRSWNVANQFMIMKSYMNTWYEFRYKFVIMKNIVMWNHISEFTCMKLWIQIWIHAAIICEFIIMNSCVNSVLWRISWNHGWILGNEFTYEIMVEFINLKLFLIQLQIPFSEGKCFTHST